MPDYRTLFDPSDYLFAHDLAGRDVVVTIERVEAGTLTGSGGKTARKPVAFFVGKAKRLALNKTNCKTLVQLSGSKDTADWHGLTVSLYPTTTTMGNETVDCVRVRPVAPKLPEVAK